MDDNPLKGLSKEEVIEAVDQWAEEEVRKRVVDGNKAPEVNSGA